MQGIALLRSEPDGVGGEGILAVLVEARLRLQVGCTQPKAQAEADRAAAAELSLQNQITSLLSNVDPAAVDSLSELLSKMSADDQSIIDLVNNLTSAVQENTDKIAELTNA